MGCSGSSARSLSPFQNFAIPQFDIRADNPGDPAWGPSRETPWSLHHETICGRSTTPLLTEYAGQRPGSTAYYNDSARPGRSTTQTGNGLNCDPRDFGQAIARLLQERRSAG